MIIQAGKICPVTLQVTIKIGDQERTGTLQSRTPTATGYLLSIDLHDGHPPLLLTENLKLGCERGTRTPLAYTY